MHACIPSTSKSTIGVLVSTLGLGSVGGCSTATRVSLFVSLSICFFALAVALALVSTEPFAVGLTESSTGVFRMSPFRVRIQS